LPAGNNFHFAKGLIVSTAIHKEASHSNGARGNGSGTMQIVSFRLAQEEYGIEITKVQEIILIGEITRMPKTPYYIRGLINLRSMVIPIVDLRLRFGMEPQETTDETRIMVVNVAGKTIGIVVDAVSEVLRIHHDQIAPPPPTIAGLGHDYLSGLVRGENRLLILLDIDNILGQTEGESLESIVQMEPSAVSMVRSAV